MLFQLYAGNSFCKISFCPICELEVPSSHYYFIHRNIITRGCIFCNEDLEGSDFYDYFTHLKEDHESEMKRALFLIHKMSSSKIIERSVPQKDGKPAGEHNPDSRLVVVYGKTGINIDSIGVEDSIEKKAAQTSTTSSMEETEKAARLDAAEDAAKSKRIILPRLRVRLDSNKWHLHRHERTRKHQQNLKYFLFKNPVTTTTTTTTNQQLDSATTINNTNIAANVGDIDISHDLSKDSLQNLFLELIEDDEVKRCISKKSGSKSASENTSSNRKRKKDDNEASKYQGDDDDPKRLWCICRQPHNNRFMICCDACGDWFHGTCVNVKTAMGCEMEQKGIKWSCPQCIKKRLEGAQRQLTDILPIIHTPSQNEEKLKLPTFEFISMPVETRDVKL